MIEDAEAVGAIDEIVSVEGLGPIFVGRADFAVSMGDAGRSGALDASVEKILRSSRSAGLPASMLAASPAELTLLRALGATGFLVGSD